jgi:hypothetical protein
MTFAPLRTLGLAGALALGGCVGDDVSTTSDSESSTGTTGTTGATETATEGTDSTTSGSESGTGTATEGTTGTTEGTTEATTEGTTETSGTTDTTTTGGGLCDAGEGVGFNFVLFPENDDMIDFEVDWMCDVVSVEAGGESGMNLEMACSDGDEKVDPNPILFVDAQPVTELAAFTPGLQLRMIYGEVYPWWSERWVRLETLGDGALMLAGVNGSSLNISDQHQVFAPYTTAYVDGVCAPEDEGCGTRERLRLTFKRDGDAPTYELLDDTFDVIDGDPGMSTWVDHATAYVGEPDCTDTPQRWFSYGMVFDGQE